MSATNENAVPITLRKTSFHFEREPLLRPFGFKGGAMTEIWQTACLVESDENHGVGLCSQNVLWCDGELFASCPEAKSNAMMRDLTVFALDILTGETFTSPMDVIDDILDDVLARAKKITGRENLRPTFALNALVGLDNALWTLYFRENGFRFFDDIIPDDCRNALSSRHERVAAIPLISYNVPVEEIKKSVEAGSFFMKIKIGRPGTQEEMLAGDIARLTEIHAAIGSMTTPATADGKLPYYFDANGRYESKETLQRFLDHAEKIGALGQIALIEEPFDELAELDVSDLPVRIAADESAHSAADVKKRIELGYGAIALKPAAKTLSISFRMAAEAAARNIPCFCADLTVNPILVDWNKNVAARLAPFPGFSCGLLESNGHQNYTAWKKLLSYLPNPAASWVAPQKGFYKTAKEFYLQSGDVFDDPGHYTDELFLH